MQVPDAGALDSTQKASPVTAYQLQATAGLALSLILPTSVLEHGFLIVLGLCLSILLQQGHRKQSFSVLCQAQHHA